MKDDIKIDMQVESFSDSHVCKGQVLCCLETGRSIASFWNDYDIEKVAQAINSHDRLVAENEKLREQINQSIYSYGVWVSVFDCTPSESCQVIAEWSDGCVEQSSYITDWGKPHFQRKCGTDENGTGWSGNVGNVIYWMPLPIAKHRDL